MNINKPDSRQSYFLATRTWTSGHTRPSHDMTIWDEESSIQVVSKRKFGILLSTISPILSYYWKSVKDTLVLYFNRSPSTQGGIMLGVCPFFPIIVSAANDIRHQGHHSPNLVHFTVVTLVHWSKIINNPLRMVRFWIDQSYQIPVVSLCIAPFLSISDENCATNPQYCRLGSPLMKHIRIRHYRFAAFWQDGLSWWIEIVTWSVLSDV